MSSLPKNPMMLLSVINTKLRDCYATLDDLCDTEDVAQEALLETLGNAGYGYHAGCNQFRRQVRFSNMHQAKNRLQPISPATHWRIASSSIARRLKKP